MSHHAREHPDRPELWSSPIGNGEPDTTDYPRTYTCIACESPCWTEDDTAKKCLNCGEWLCLACATENPKCEACLAEDVL